MNIDILYIDPIGKQQSGITSYIKSAQNILKDNGVNTYVLSLKYNENLEHFRKRVALFVSKHHIRLIEAPETQYSTKYVVHDNIHIRLHCSKIVGNYFQSLNIDEKLKAEEQLILDRAKYISAPSKIIAKVSTQLFKINKKIIIYPNPIQHNSSKTDPSQHSQTQLVPKIYFFSRGEKLKGLDFLPYFSHLDIYCIGDHNLKRYIKRHKKIKSFHYINGLEKSSLEQIKSGDIVIIPSIFESWSMVATEALTQYARIVTWSHLGICEYLSSPLNRYLTQAWQVEQFYQNIINALKAPFELASYQVAVNKFIHSINENFLGCTLTILQNKSLELYYIPYDKIILPPIIHIKKNEAKTMRVIKKFKKLLRNPKQFFKDAHVINTLLPEQTKAKVVAKVDANIKTKTTESKIQTTQPIPSLKNNELKLLLSPSGFVTFPNIQSKKPELKAIFIYPKRLKDVAHKITEKLYLHQDFLPLRENELVLGYYSDDISHYSIKEIMDKINNNNKERLSQYLNIFVYDENDHLASAIRYSNYRVTVTQIYHINEKENYIYPNHDWVDYYIYPKNEFNPQTKRKYFIYANEHELSLFIRKILQETLPREVNLLLPVISNTQFIAENLIEYSQKKIDILLKMKPIRLPKQTINHQKMCRLMSQETIELFVKENVFLKYQHLLSQPNQESIAQFYILASQDSLRFGVIYA